jgi:hypothetical protein
MCHVTFCFLWKAYFFKPWFFWCVYFSQIRQLLENYGTCTFPILRRWETIDAPSTPLSSVSNPRYLFGVRLADQILPFNNISSYVIFQWIEPLNPSLKWWDRCLNVHHWDLLDVGGTNLTQRRHQIPIYYGWRWHGMLTTERQYSEYPSGSPRQMHFGLPMEISPTDSCLSEEHHIDLLSTVTYIKRLLAVFNLFCAGALCKMLEFYFSLYYGN